MVKSCYLATTLLAVITLLPLTVAAVEPTPAQDQPNPSVKHDQQPESPDCNCQSADEPAKAGDERSPGNCICDKYPVFDLGGAWLFYADLYDSCDNCINPTTVWDIETPPYQTYTCPDCHGFFAGSAKPVKLSQRKPWPYTKAQFFSDLYQILDIPELKDLRLDYTVEGDGKTIEFFVDGSPIYANVFLISVKPVGHELIVGGLGIEVEPPPSTVPAEGIFKVFNVATHPHMDHAYDVQIGLVTYLVVTAQ